MAGVDLLTIKEVGGWRTLAMVQRYAHFAPGQPPGRCWTAGITAARRC